MLLTETSNHIDFNIRGKLYGYCHKIYKFSFILQIKLSARIKICLRSHKMRNPLFIKFLSFFLLFYPIFAATRWAYLKKKEKLKKKKQQAKYLLSRDALTFQRMSHESVAGKYHNEFRLCISASLLFKQPVETDKRTVFTVATIMPSSRD